MTRSGYLELVVLVVILGAATYEAAVALEWIPVGTLPGESARFEGVVLTSALLALVVGIVISLILARTDRRSVPAALFAVAAAALMVARYYTFDTYDLPTLIRYSESEAFSPAWVFSVATAGVLASLLGLTKPRIGLVLTAVVMLLCTFTAVFFGFGH
jgi:hypothetical protein